MAKLDFPSSPTDGQVYAAPNGVDYTWNATVNAWTAKVTEPLTLVSNGSISGTAEVGKNLVYTLGEAAGGISPYDYTWEWRLTSDNSVIQTNGLTLTIPAAAVGDTIYIALTATDAAASTATGTTDVYPIGGNVITYASFPNLSFGPIAGPNASPSTVSLAGEGLYGEVSATWEDGFTNIYATGDIQFSVNGGAYGTSSQSVSNGDTVSVIWDATAIAGAADGATLNGILTNGTYENGFAITVDRAPTGLVFADLVDQSLSTVITSDTVTPTGFNVPVPVSFVGSATALTSLGLSVAGGAFGASPQNVIPGQSLQLQGTTGGANGTAYGVDIAMGSNPTATDTWTVTTASVAAAIAEPSITSPANGATDINPAVNSPAGVQLVGSDYTPLNGAGAQTSSEWEVYANGLPSTYDSTNTISAVSGPAVPSGIGASYGGGYYAGQILGSGGTSGGGMDDSGVIYNLVVAPVVGGAGQFGQRGGTSPSGSSYKTVNIADAAVAKNQNWGYPATESLATTGINPVFTWCVNGPNGPRSNGGIGGFTDWYIPSLNEMAILYFFLKPTTQENFTGSGSNPVSVAPYTPNTSYGASFPDQTTSTLFQAGGSEEFSLNTTYWTSTEDASNSGTAWRTYFADGQASLSGKDNINLYSRAIRRVAASNLPGSTVTLTLSGANTDGFAVGMNIVGTSSGATGTITGINGTTVTITQTSTTQWTTSDKIRGTGTAVSGSPFTVSSAPFETINIAQSAFSTSSTYYARVQYASAITTSNYSAWSEFGTASDFSIAPGTAMGGGYFGGQINVGGTIYNLIVSPTDAGNGLYGRLQGGSGAGALVQYKTTADADSPAGTAQNDYYGAPATVAFGDASHPAFNFVKNQANGPNAGSYDATNSLGTGIGGYNDWYLPALYEMITIYYFLKPQLASTEPNDTSYGFNPYAVAPQPVNTNYTTTNPDQTTSSLFQTGGAEAFITGSGYWTSTEGTGDTTRAYTIAMTNGRTLQQQKTYDISGGQAVVAIRRVAA